MIPFASHSVIPTIQVCLQAALLLAVSLGLWFTTRQLGLLRAQVGLLQATYRDLHDWNRRKAAQDAVEKFKDFGADQKLLNEHFQALDRTDPIGLTEILATCKAAPELKQALHRKLNYFESLAVGVRNKVYDEELLKDALCGAMEQDLRLFREYIEHRRAKGFQRAWADFDALSTKWEANNKTLAGRAATGSAA